MADTRLWDVERTARELQCSVWLVRRLIKLGLLAPTRLGRRVLVAPESVEAFVRRSTAKVRPIMELREVEPRKTTAPQVGQTKRLIDISAVLASARNESGS